MHLPEVMQFAWLHELQRIVKPRAGGNGYAGTASYMPKATERSAWMFGRSRLHAVRNSDKLCGVPWIGCGVSEGANIRLWKIDRFVNA